ncbi:MAG: AarF/UbiB family protein [Cetobacterium sp.]|nr:AarF/UbiB family protein [Cetobacterium sp.]
MFSLKFLRLIQILDSNRVPSISHIQELDYFGTKALEYYTSRIDIVKTPIIYRLLKIYNERTFKDDMHFLDILQGNNKEKHPLIFNLEYFDSTPFETLETFNIYRGNLKIFEDVAIKISRKNSKNLKKQIHSLEKLTTFSHFLPNGHMSENLKDVVKYCKNSMELEYDLNNHHCAMNYLKKMNEAYLPKYPVLKFLKFSKEFNYLSEKNVYVSKFIDNGRPLNIALAKEKLTMENISNLIYIRLIHLLDIGIFPKNNSNRDIIVDDDGYFYFRNFHSLCKLHKKNKKILNQFIKSLLNEDFSLALNYILLLSINSKQIHEDIGFKEEGLKYLEENFSNNRNINIIKIILNLFKIADTHKFKFSSDIFDFFKELIFIKLIILNCRYKIELFTILKDFINNLNS